MYHRVPFLRLLRSCAWTAVPWSGASQMWCVSSGPLIVRHSHGSSWIRWFKKNIYWPPHLTLSISHSICLSSVPKLDSVLNCIIADLKCWIKCYVLMLNRIALVLNRILSVTAEWNRVGTKSNPIRSEFNPLTAESNHTRWCWIESHLCNIISFHRPNPLLLNRIKLVLNRIILINWQLINLTRIFVLHTTYTA